MTGARARIEPWQEDDLGLLQALLGDPAMMVHLGGPEPAAKIADRHARYLRTDDQFRIVEAASGEAVGWVGFWPREWQGTQIYEIGWSVLPAYQGRGLARAATELAIDAAREAGGADTVHAYPAVDNAPSNALCRRLGFTLLGAFAFEYPPGHALQCNDWALALR